MKKGGVVMADKSQALNNDEALKDQQLLKKLKRISAKGNNAEVKQNRDGTWVIYEVKKIKEVV